MLTKLSFSIKKVVIIDKKKTCSTFKTGLLLFVAILYEPLCLVHVHHFSPQGAMPSMLIKNIVYNCFTSFIVIRQ